MKFCIKGKSNLVVLVCSSPTLGLITDCGKHLKVTDYTYILSRLQAKKGVV